MVLAPLLLCGCDAWHWHTYDVAYLDADATPDTATMREATDIAREIASDYGLAEAPATPPCAYLWRSQSKYIPTGTKLTIQMSTNTIRVHLEQWRGAYWAAMGPTEQFEQLRADLFRRLKSRFGDRVSYWDGPGAPTLDGRSDATWTLGTATE